jgi:hypothetical protein
MLLVWLNEQAKKRLEALLYCTLVQYGKMRSPEPDEGVRFAISFGEEKIPCFGLR